jgi:hypothetical protein
MSSGSGKPSSAARPPQKWPEGIDEEHGFRNRLSTASFAENAGHYRWSIRLTIRGQENKYRTWRIANQLTQVSVAARHSWHADACENVAVISPLRQSCLSIANKVYAAAKRDWKCRYG